MTELDDHFEEQVASIAEGTYLEDLEPNQRDRLVGHLNARIDGRVFSTDLYGLVLVLFNLRPACIVHSEQRTISRERALDIADHSEDATRWDPVGQLLDQYEIPFELLPNVTETRIEGVTSVHLNYHISLDETRVREFVADNTESPTDERLMRADEKLLGEFLGYPDAAIETYCDRDHEDHGLLIESVDAEELEQALGAATELYDVFDLDYRSFTKYLVPYVVPATAPECLDRLVTDATRAFMGGFVVRERYGCTVLDEVISDYRERLEPDAE